MKKIAIACAVVSICSSAHATDAPAGLVPSGLSPGDTFYLLSATLNTTGAEAADLTALPTFVTNDITTNGTSDVKSVTWNAFVCTASSVAATLISTTTVPIYNVNQDKIADNAADLFDGSIDNPVGYSSNGGVQTGRIWTGCGDDGLVDGVTQVFGHDSNGQGTIGGNADTSDSTWIVEFSFIPNTPLYPIFIVSELLTVPAATSASASSQEW